MIEEFEEFKDKENDFAGIPIEWSDKFMIHQICEGDVTREPWILEHYSYDKAVQWMMFKRYEDYAGRGGKKTGEK